MKSSRIFNSLKASIYNSIQDAADGIAHIFITGGIVPDGSEYAQREGYICLARILKQVHEAQSAKEFIVHIHSPGGDVNEGFAIHDVLVASGKKITTQIEGLCASIATVISLAGSTRKMNENSDFFIHNPWGDPYYMTGFTADDYTQRGEEIRVAENKLLDFYVKKTGADRETIASMMKVQTTMSADKALELKFITEIVLTTNASKSVGVFASLGTPSTPKPNTEMKNKKGLLAKIKALFNELDGETSTIQNASYTLKDGTAIEVEGALEVGSAVTVNGDPISDGSHVLSDDRTLVCAGGKITEIQPAPEADANASTETPVVVTPTETEVALTNALAEIETLKASVSELKAAKEEADRLSAEAETEISAELEKLRGVVAKAKLTTSTFTPEGREFENTQSTPVDKDSNEAVLAKRRADLAKQKEDAKAKVKA